MSTQQRSSSVPTQAHLNSPEPFDFQPRTRVIFGAGSLDRLGELAAGLGGSRALVVSDPGIVGEGYTERALRSLEAAGLAAFLFHDVEKDPTTRHVDAGVSFTRQHEVDLIIGLGGGSSMDCAKGINFLLTNGGKMADYWGVGKAKHRMLPLVAVPTTAGTGSDAQSFALIADEKTRQKMACGDPKAAPAIALLDPELTLTQPPYITAVTGIDAVSHAIETWVTTKRNPISRLYSREAWCELRDNFHLVLGDPSDLEARAGMLLGAHFAGAAIENSMLGVAHSCANPVTARYGVVHGAAVGMLLPTIIRFNAEEMGDLYADLAESGDGAGDLARFIDEMLEQTGLPRRLSNYAIPEEALPQLAAEAARQWTVSFNPRPVTAKECLEIYRCVY